MSRVTDFISACYSVRHGNALDREKCQRPKQRKARRPRSPISVVPATRKR